MPRRSLAKGKPKRGAPPTAGRAEHRTALASQELARLALTIESDDDLAPFAYAILRLAYERVIEELSRRRPSDVQTVAHQLYKIIVTTPGRARKDGSQAALALKAAGAARRRFEKALARAGEHHTGTRLAEVMHRMSQCALPRSSPGAPKATFNKYEMLETWEAISKLVDEVASEVRGDARKYGTMRVAGELLAPSIDDPRHWAQELEQRLEPHFTSWLADLERRPDRPSKAWRTQVAMRALYSKSDPVDVDDLLDGDSGATRFCQGRYRIQSPNTIAKYLQQARRGV